VRVAGVKVQLILPTAAGAVAAEATTDRQGRYHLTARADIYTLAVEQADCSGLGTVELRPSQTATQDITCIVALPHDPGGIPSTPAPSGPRVTPSPIR
jgi:hypothetical protein